MGWVSTLAEWWHSNASIIAAAELAILIMGGICTYLYRRSLMGKIDSLMDKVDSVTGERDSLESKIDSLHVTMQAMIGKPPEEQRRLVDKADVYIPIRTAIRHIIHTTPHSHRNAQMAADHYFKVLHEHICSGKIKAVGRKDEDGELQRISKRECKRHLPVIEVVMPNPSAPEGVRYCLVARTRPTTLSPLDDVEVDGFTDIRVRSRDLYRWWPKQI